MSSSILATWDWMLPTISLSGDIVGYLPSSQTNLQAQQGKRVGVGGEGGQESVASRQGRGKERSRPGEVGVDGDAIDGEGPGLDAPSALEVLDLPPDLVRDALDEDVGLREGWRSTA